jgi:Tfp pilus assembly protein PilV
MRIASRTSPGRRQRGATLIEVLVGFVALTIGIMAIARLQVQLRTGADLSRQRSEAVRLVQEDIESLRSFASVGDPSAAHAFDAIDDAQLSVDAASEATLGADYLITRTIEDAAIGHAKNATVTASWVDRTGAPQTAVLSTVLAGLDPAYTGALSLVRASPATGRVGGRSPAIPTAAKDLGNGTSALKPVSIGTVALVFDNGTGMLVGRCTGIGSLRATRDLTRADLHDCDTRAGYLLSGLIRYSYASPPDLGGRDLPLPAALSLTLTGGPYPAAPSCFAESMKAVVYTANASTRIESVPLAATASSFGLSGWRETGDRHLAYFCAVYPGADGRWSGRFAIVPIAWTIAPGQGGYRVCRYTNDLDHSGKIDANIEHPDPYKDVDRALAQQNFLVINGPETCPGTGSGSGSGSGSDAAIDTAQHQP